MVFLLKKQFSKFTFLLSGLYVENVMEVAKIELAWEVDYVREAECGRKFK